MTRGCAGTPSFFSGRGFDPLPPPKPSATHSKPYLVKRTTAAARTDGEISSDSFERRRFPVANEGRRGPAANEGRRGGERRQAAKRDMETDQMNVGHDVEEDEYVLLDLSDVCGKLDIHPGAPYVLSGLDTMNPVLTIGDKLKLIGEYEETVGTCLVFSETEKPPVVHEETGASEANLFQGIGIVDPNHTPEKVVKPVTSLHKILKFRLLSGPGDAQDSSEQPADTSS